MDTTLTPAELAEKDGVPPVITTRELSDLTGWPTNTLLRWISEGKVPVIRKTPGTYLLDRSVLNKLRRREETDPFRPAEPPQPSGDHVPGQLPLPAH